MKLSNLKDSIKDINVIIDAEFNALGMATSKFNKVGVLSFLSEEKFIQSIENNKMISAIIITSSLYEKIDVKNIGIIISDNPKALFYKIHNYLVEKEFYWEDFKTEIDTSTIIHPGVNIPKKNLKIGKNCVIEEGVIIHEGVIINDNVIIRSGTILGSNGFQFLNDGEVVFQVKTGGLLTIGNNVEVQHNCCLDRGVLGGVTILHDNVKVDNFVHIAHDCVIGERTLITAGVKFGGRTIVGNDCWIGINSTISNGLNIGNNVTISLGSVVTRDVADNLTVTGNFAIEHKKFIDFIKSIR
jgi:UDP-3-O-[3-hydroxymyristoyl] glucosamine N-acyltransferase